MKKPLNLVRTEDEKLKSIANKKTLYPRMWNGQSSKKHTRLTKRNAQRKQKKLCDISHADTTDLWRSKEVALLTKP